MLNNFFLCKSFLRAAVQKETEIFYKRLLHHQMPMKPRDVCKSSNWFKLNVYCNNLLIENSWKKLKRFFFKRLKRVKIHLRNSSLRWYRKWKLLHTQKWTQKKKSIKVIPIKWQKNEEIKFNSPDDSKVQYLDGAKYDDWALYG